MHLKQILTDSRSAGLAPAPKFRISLVRKAQMELATKFTEAEKPLPVVELEEVAKRLEHSVRAISLNQISRRDWAKAGWCLWLENHVLASFPGFLDEYFKRIHYANRRSNYKKLISAYLRDYHPKQVNIHKVGEFLASGVMKWEWEWARRQRDFRLFGVSGPEIVARECLASREPVQSFLRSVGLGENAGDCGFALEAYKRGLAELNGFGRERFDKCFQRILEWGADSDGIRYPGSLRELAETLLGRWDEETPTEQTKQVIEEFILKHFKDPRIPSAPGSKWAHVEPGAKSVFLRWLVGAALEQFLQIVDKVALESQWKYRRAFWMAYYKLGVIDEAWVAFALKGRVATKQSFGQMRGFGRLEGPGISPDHAVLIMKMGGMTIADWSHNGKCHIWTEANLKAPKLYQDAYDRNALVMGSSNNGVVHSSASSGTWQATVASYIGKHTNIRLGFQDYMPKGRR